MAVISQNRVIKGLNDYYLEEKNKGLNELYGVNIVCDYICKIKPDLVFLYNDVIVISRIFNNFIKNCFITQDREF